LLDGDEYRLCIAGGGPLSAEIQKAEENDSRIKFYGFVSLAEVLALYRSADVLVNMRLTKALKTQYFFPSKMMEYLASGTPVISTCTGHVESEFGDLLFLLKDETAGGLAAMIGQLRSMNPELLAERGIKARNYMAQHKTWDAQGLKVVNYISALFPCKA
jgi:glycosyltransferase involved in cell wall biosynthesis